MLRSFDIYNEQIFESDCQTPFNILDFYRFKIFKKLNIIPKCLTKDTYTNYRLITTRNFKIKISIVLKLKIPNVIWICICRKLFGNNL